MFKIEVNNIDEKTDEKILKDIVHGSLVDPEKYPNCNIMFSINKKEWVYLHGFKIVASGTVKTVHKKYSVQFDHKWKMMFSKEILDIVAGLITANVAEFMKEKRAEYYYSIPRMQTTISIDGHNDIKYLCDIYDDGYGRIHIENKLNNADNASMGFLLVETEVEE